MATGRAPKVQEGQKPQTLAPSGPEGGTAAVETGAASGQPITSEKKGPDAAAIDLANQMARDKDAGDVNQALIDAASAKDSQQPSLLTPGQTEQVVAEARNRQTLTKQKIQQLANGAAGASQPQETIPPTSEEMQAARSFLVLTRSKSEVVDQFIKWIRMGTSNTGQALTAQQEIQQAHDQFVTVQTEIAMARLEQGDTIEQIVGDGRSLFQEQRTTVRATMEAEAQAAGTAQDETWETEVRRRSLHAYFQQRDKITTEIGGLKGKELEKYEEEMLKQIEKRIMEQAKAEGKTQVTDKAIIEQVHREYADLWAEAMSARPEGLPTEVMSNPRWVKKYAEVFAAQQDLAQRNGIQMDEAWKRNVDKLALTSFYMDQLKEKKTLLQILLEMLRELALSGGIILTNELKNEFEAVATGK